jgi:serine/threonine protein kinase
MKRPLIIEDAIMPFAIGQNVGPYRILEQLGQGGMATVYKAYHAALDRFVAIKVLHLAFREDATFVARFIREARVVAKLDHPHIVPIYDFSECDGQPYLVMKYIEGETLKARLARSPLSATEAITVVKAVGSALAYAHSKDVLHRDIKPSNIILGSDGNIFLADFGLARMAQSSDLTLSSSDILMGTPHYISPEQAQGIRDLDAGTDIYSMGVVIYELAVGRVPFNSDTPFSIVHDHIFTPLPLPRSINPKVPEEIERVLLKALAKERKDRYATVEDLVSAFVTATQGIMVKTTAAKARVKAQAQSSIPTTVPAEGAEAPAPISASPVGDEKPSAAKKKEKGGRKLPWWGWGLLAVGSCVCLILFVLIARGISNRNNLKNTETPNVVQSTNVTLSLASTKSDTTPTPESTPGKPTLDETSIPVDARVAWQLFNSGMALWEGGDKDAATKDFQSALDLLPASRTMVIILAAQKLNAAGDWSMASSFCIKGLVFKPNDLALNRISEEVMYRLAGERDGTVVLRPFVTEHPELAVANMAYARWLVEHTNNYSEMRQYIDAARKSGNGSINLVVKVVQGEYQLYTSDTKNGIDTLNGVIQDPNSPPWLKAEAQRLIKAWS